MRVWRSIEFRLKITPFVTLGTALILSWFAVSLLNSVGLLDPDIPFIGLSMTLFFTAFFGILINLMMIPFIIRPLRNFDSKLMALNERKEIKEMKIEQFPDFKIAIKTMQDYIQWAEKQTSMSTMINQAIREKAQKAERDMMTGLYNKAYFYNYMPDEMARSKTLNDPLSLLMLDIDHFKVYNDTNGHQAGDDILIKIAHMMNVGVRDLDICVRFGGEEFIIVLPKSGEDRAKKLAERFRKGLEETQFLHGETQPGGRITASIGIATFPNHASTVEGLVEMADLALYQSKKLGRNRVTVYGEAMPKPEIDEEIEIIDASDLG